MRRKGLLSVYKSQPLYCILSQMSPIQTLVHYIFFNIGFLFLCLQSEPFPYDFSRTVLWAFPICPIHATYFAHLILGLVAVIIYGEECTLWSTSLCNVLRPSRVTGENQHPYSGWMSFSPRCKSAASESAFRGKYRCHSKSMIWHKPFSCECRVSLVLCRTWAVVLQRLV
jgi:hypothetical protein